MNTSKLVVAIASTLTIGLSAIPAETKEIDRDTLCRQFPLNSRCQDYQVTKSKPKIYTLERDSFCDRFPLNSRCQQPAVEVIKLNLDRSGNNDEWIRIEKQANTIELLHTTRVKDALTSAALNGALGLVPFPLPFVKANQHNWEDHQVLGMSFQSDRCNTDSCIITATEALELPAGTDIFAGLFTIDYLEKDLRRSVSFRIPADAKIEAIETIIVETY